MTIWYVQQTIKRLWQQNVTNWLFFRRKLYTKNVSEIMFGWCLTYVWLYISKGWRVMRIIKVSGWNIYVRQNVIVKFGPRREKTCLRGFWWSDIQTRLLSYRDKLENQKFARSKSRYITFQKENYKGADHMRRLVCAFGVRKPPKTGFLASRPKCK